MDTLGISSASVGSIINNDEYLKLKKRDSQYLQELFVDINPRLVRMMAAKGIYNENAEEIIHECWETFFSNLEKYEGRSSIRTFIFGILINKIRENRRRVDRIEYEEDSEKVFDRSFTVDGWWTNEPTDPMELIANKQLKNLIAECLHGLTENQKNAFLLIEADGETAEDTCSILGVSLSNLRVLIFRAKDKLRTCLEGRSFST